MAGQLNKTKSEPHSSVRILKFYQPEDSHDHFALVLIQWIEISNLNQNIINDQHASDNQGSKYGKRRRKWNDIFIGPLISKVNIHGLVSLQNSFVK